tara:strand:+ start:1413 stop:1604 length:192 start_codon:yes stop_codon:yes gene_type:complete
MVGREVETKSGIKGEILKSELKEVISEESWGLVCVADVVTTNGDNEFKLEFDEAGTTKWGPNN